MLHVSYTHTDREGEGERGERERRERERERERDVAKSRACKTHTALCKQWPVNFNFRSRRRSVCVLCVGLKGCGTRGQPRGGIESLVYLVTKPPLENHWLGLFRLGNAVP